jgi:hypothetical protein
MGNRPGDTVFRSQDFAGHNSGLKGRSGLCEQV